MERKPECDHRSLLSLLDDDVLSHYQLPARRDTHRLLHVIAPGGSMIRVVHRVIGVFKRTTSCRGKRLPIVNVSANFHCSFRATSRRIGLLILSTSGIVAASHVQKKKTEYSITTWEVAPRLSRGREGNFEAGVEFNLAIAGFIYTRTEYYSFFFIHKFFLISPCSAKIDRQKDSPKERDKVKIA